MGMHASVSIGFVALVFGSFGGTGPIAIGAGVGAPMSRYFVSPVVRSLPAERKAPSAPAGVKIPIFNESDFPFVTINRDDGEGPSGGWQEANANLEFIKIRDIPPSVTKWKCPITIGMPIRHSARGYISPSRAANMSAFVTNSVMLAMDFELPQGIFCSRFLKGVQEAFPSAYPKLGESVRKW